MEGPDTQPNRTTTTQAETPAASDAMGAQQARSMAMAENGPVLHELLTRSEMALTVMAVLSIALGWLVAGQALRPVRSGGR